MTAELRLPLEAARVRLRRFRAEDAEPFAAYRALPEIARFQSWPRPYTRPMAERLVDEMASAPAVVAGRWFQLAIASRDDDRLLGDIGLCRDERDHAVAELGFSLMPEAQGRGLMSEALGTLLAVLPELGIAEVTAVVDARNAPSIALLERLGFVAEGEQEAEYFGEACVDRSYRRSLDASP